MESVAPSKAIAPPPAQASEPTPTARAAKQRVADHAAALRSEVIPDKVTVSLDPQAQRFVSTLIDAETFETLRKHPSDAQLAYSRAVMAYLRIISGNK